jgi:hypothetical protein
VEFRTLATALSTDCCPQARSSQGPVLLTMDWIKSARQVCASDGNRKPRKLKIATKISDANPTLNVINVSGGMVSSARLIHM